MWLTIRVHTILLILGFSYDLSGQTSTNYRIENITSEYLRIDRGLSQNTVYCILQDKEGYLWIGTWSGLNRFDGYQFRVLNRDSYNPENGLTSGTIVGITEDTLGYIWAASEKGLNRIRKTDLAISQFTTLNSGSLGMVSDSLRTLFSGRSGRIWIGSNRGMMILDPGSIRFTGFEHNPRDYGTISSNVINDFEEDRQGNVYIATNRGLNKINPSNGQIIRFDQNWPDPNAPQLTILVLEFDETGILWIGTSAGLFSYSPLNRKFRKYVNIPELSDGLPGTEPSITSLHSYKGVLWIGTEENSLVTYEIKTKIFRNLKDQLPQSTYFSYNTFFTIQHDRAGIIWLGTSHKGIIKLSPDPGSFRTLLQGNTVYGIIEPRDNELWMGTLEGLVVHNYKTGTSQIMRHQAGDPRSISNNQINNLIDDPPYVWVCTRNGLNQIHLPTGNIRVFKKDSTDRSIAGNQVWDVFKDTDQTYWIATTNGLSHWDPVKDTFINYFHSPGNPNSLSNNFCLDVNAERPGVLLISTQYGLNRFTPSTNAWQVFLPSPGDYSSISAEDIFGVYHDSQEVIWVYTNGGGINRYDPAYGTFEHYTVDEGMADNVVYGMLEDQDGVFWMITNNGLGRYKPIGENFSVFDVQDGLLSNEFNINSIFSRNSGELVVGGVNGASAFFPHTTNIPTPALDMIITRFQVHTGIESHDLTIADTLRIKAFENTFTISFSSMNFLNPFKTSYLYKLEGFDREWTRITSGVHQVDYRRVPPGNYTYMVYATNTQGNNSKTKRITLLIIPAWYRTTLFFVASIGFIVVLITLMIYFRWRNLRNKHEIEKQLLTTQTELIRSQKFALRSQMNPHFIFNSLNSIQNFVLKNDVDSANYYLSNFSIMMRKVLEFSQYNFITLAEELELINLYLKMEKLRFSRKFDIKIEVSKEIDEHMVRIPPMLLQPYLENAILHGLQLIKHKGLLQVLVTDHDDHLSICIEDDGIGREKANQIRQRSAHKSKGLANIEKRIQLYNRISDNPIVVNIVDLKNTNGEPSGTRVEIDIPYELESQSENPSSL